MGIQPPVGLVLAQEAQSGLLDTTCEVVEAAIATAGIELVGRTRKDIGTRIADAIDAMAEAHQALSAIEFRANDSLGALGTADLEDHLERRPGRAAMQRPLQCADGAC